MRALVIAALAVAAVVAGTLVIGRTAPVDEEQAAKQTSSAFLANLAKGDQKALGATLDRRFTWINTEGKTRTRSETLRELPALAAANRGDVDVQTHFYGRMLTVRGSHDDARFLRVFVKRRHGWKAFALMETPVAPSGQQASVERAAGAGDCDNPCRTVPYTPKTAMDKDILAAWQKTKMLEWKPDAAQWASFIADEFMIINNTTIRDKEARVAIAKRQQEAGVGAPGDPVTAMRIYDFGTTCALMTSQHTPYRGGKPYTNVRIWVLRDGRWQLALSQQVATQSAAPAPAVASVQ
jgi:ketosteroid isomerase-like protein